MSCQSSLPSKLIIIWSSSLGFALQASYNSGLQESPSFQAFFYKWEKQSLFNTHTDSEEWADRKPANTTRLKLKLLKHLIFKIYLQSYECSFSEGIGIK